MESPENQKLKPAEQFNAGHKEYTPFIETDPIRNFLHYPSVIKELGEVSGKRILDIGCGDGLFDRKLAMDYGARVVGYDISPNLVAKAQQSENDKPLGIHYEVADPATFRANEPFDGAVTVMVFPYAPDEEYLKNFFASAYANLKVGGKFVSITFNPQFDTFNKVIMNRYFRKGEGNKIGFDFLELQTGEVKFSAELAQFSQADYEQAARDGGFRKIEWKFPEPTEEGAQKLGAKFWQKADNERPYAIIVAEK